MPNYITNKLGFGGTDEEVRQLTEDLALLDRNGHLQLIDFNRIVPRPKNPPEGWYNWSVQNWGTKWNVDDGERRGDHLVFDTAWNPPTSFVATLAERYPHIDIYHYWCGSILDDYAGRHFYEDGVLLPDSQTELEEFEDMVKHYCFIHDLDLKNYIKRYMEVTKEDLKEVEPGDKFHVDYYETRIKDCQDLLAEICSNQKISKAF